MVMAGCRALSRFARVAIMACAARPGAPPADPAASAFSREVLGWLDAEAVPWRPLALAGASGPVVAVGAGALALHLLASPRGPAEALAAGATARLTDACGDALQLVHLHEDVWRLRGEIARARLLARAGRPTARLAARQTVARKIPMEVYAPFLDRHHLWGATKAKHGYGLFDKADGTLAAVATFSARRRVLRHGAPHASHELLRLCARRDLSVVGGISKLVAAFVAAHGADDVVTVVDRDWGGAAGWAAAGFARVQTMPPMPMAVGADGRRVHLVGVGLAPAPTDAAAPLSTRDALRAGLPAAAAAALAGAADASAAADCLSACGYALLHDAGVERLLRLTPRASEATAAADAAAAAAAAWAASSPKYASAHYSPNPGVAALCAAAARAPPADGASVAREQASFRQAGPPRLIASAASRAGAGAAGGGGARVEVHARADGWRTLRVDNGLGCHVLHSVVNVDADGVARADAVASEYLLTMAALVLAALEPAEGAGVAAPARCLHLGLGGASLVRLLAAALPGSTHDAVEIDGAVVDALALLGGAGALRDVHVADATEWVAARAAAGARGGYDAILIDCFDHEGGCPPALLAAGCLAAVRGLLSARGVAVHNLHSGGRARQAELALAESAYAAAFGGGGLRVDALDSRPHAGNALLCVGGGLGAAPALRARADAARARAGLECDLGARVAGARPLRAAGGGGGGAAGA